ncbi:histidine phosphatase family protein [Streptomyces cinereospinus]
MPLIRSHRIGACSVSPARRARETADLIGLHGAVRVDADLVEWDHGGYEGITTVEIRRERPGWFRFTDAVVPGPPEHPGESVRQVGARADRMLDEVDAALAATGGAWWCWCRTGTSRGCRRHGGSGCRRGTARWSSRDGGGGRLGTEHGRPVAASRNVGPGS